MNRQQRWLWVKSILLQLMLYSLSACAIFSGDEDPVKKDEKVRLQVPSSPYQEVNITSADRVWQSTVTGNTIALNTACQPGSGKKPLEEIGKRLLSDVDQLKIEKVETVTVDGAPAEKTQAQGVTGNIPIEIEAVTIKKGDCIYDLAYVSRKATFQTEQHYFDVFIERFRIP